MADIRLPPCPEEPRASVLVIARRNVHLLARSLSALARHGIGTVPCELILVLNDPEPAVRSFVEREVAGARVVRSDVNLGFAGANNLAARAARGEYFVLLNDDAEPEPGWLEALVRCADAHPGAGAVGSRILYPDGTLQEAGSIVWDDGTTAPVGRGLPAGTSRFRFVRQVDYCSGCSLLVRRSTWTRVGGLSDDYFPIYYEDTDLCMAIARDREAVLYCPDSVVVHHESQSTDASFKRFLFARNGRTFHSKWAPRLSAYEPVNPTSPAAVARAVLRARGTPRRLLVIDDLVPDDRLGSGLPRMKEALLELAARYAVTFFATDGPPATTTPLSDAGIEVVEGPLDAVVAAPEVLFDAVLISRPHNFEGAAAAVRRCQPQAALVYDAEALFHVRLERRAATTQDVTERAAMEREATAMRTLEATIADEADRIVCLSHDEARFFTSPAGAPVSVVRPTLQGVRFTTSPFEQRSDVAFVAGWLGGEGSPNVAALHWFVREVMPIVAARAPWARLLVTGHSPPPSIVRLASASVVLTGAVASLAELYERVAVAIAPVRYGAGVKNKSMEAVQYGVPLVATRQGAEGVDVAEPGALWVADEPEGFAEGVVSLLTSRARWDAARRACRLSVNAWEAAPRVTWPAIVESALAELTGECVAERAARSVDAWRAAGRQAPLPGRHVAGNP